MHGSNPKPDAENSAPPFTPVPLRTRTDGWTTARQNAFVDALRRTGSVDCAAAAVGMSRASAYRLRARLGAGSFAAAWDAALVRPRIAASVAASSLASLLWGRAVNGRVVPTMRKGRQVGHRIRPDNVTALALLRRFDSACGPAG